MNTAQPQLEALLESDLVTEPTRAALRSRLEPPAPSGFFTPDEFALLEAVSQRLIPHQPASLAAQVDARLWRGEGKGWRFDALPPDNELYRLGLRGLEQLARTQYGSSFVALRALEIDEILMSVQRGQVSGAVWDELPAVLFFTELLTELTELHYSHPLVQLEQLGYAGFADAHGWQTVDLNSRQAWEPK